MSNILAYKCKRYCAILWTLEGNAEKELEASAVTELKTESGELSFSFIFEISDSRIVAMDGTRCVK